MRVADGLAEIHAFLDRHPKLFILTGAGCSTGSGIPDYRDGAGQWKRAQPMTIQAFMGSAFARQRYWARSLLGWRRFSGAKPNGAHRALARFEAQGRCEMLLTQNVDGLHQAAGSQSVIDLHGRLDRVRCMGCESRSSRAAFQERLGGLNPGWLDRDVAAAPDGDADLDEADFAAFNVPSCPHCGGILKPDVVFFGEGVPRERVDAGAQAVEKADAMLIVGSSLMVYSGYRFAEMATAAGKPIAAINKGRTRADGLIALKVEEDCADALDALTARESPHA